LLFVWFSAYSVLFALFRLLDWKEFGQAITQMVYELILQKGS